MTKMHSKQIWNRFRNTIKFSLLFQKKIRNKLLFIVLALTAMNFMFFSFLSVRTKTSYLHWNTERQNQLHVDELARYINSYFLERCKYSFHHIESLAISPTLSPEDFQDLFTTLAASSPELIAVQMQNSKKDTIYFQGRPSITQAPQLAADDFSLPLDKELIHLHFLIGKAKYFPEFKTMALPIKYILMSTQNKKGSPELTIYYTFDKLIQQITTWRTGPQSEIILVNDHGELLHHPRLSLGTKLSTDLTELHQRMSHSNTFAFPYTNTNLPSSLNDQGIKVFRSYAFCPFLDWGVFLEQNVHILNHQVSRMRWVLLLLLIGPMLFTLSLGLLFVRQVVRPLEELEDGIKLFETGLLAEALPVRSQDEIGRLTQAFNQMVQTLVTRNEEIQRKTRKLSFFNEITSIINQSIDLNTFLDRGLRKILQMMQVSYGWIYVFDPQLKKLSLISHSGVPEHLVPKLSDLSFADALMKKTYASGKPSLIRDVSRHLKAMKKESPDIFRDLLLVPLRSKKRIVGVLAIASSQKYYLHYKDLDQLTRIGSELGIAVENALLYIELQLKIKEREEVNKDLQEMDRFKNRILSNVSHELRTPITSIKTYTELFLSDKIGPLNDEQKDKLQIVSRNVNNLLNLINDLLTLARIQDQKMLLKNMEVVVLQELVDNVIADTIEMAKAKGLQLLREGLQDPGLIRANRQKIQQVLQNLVANAIKFTEQGSIKIQIRLLIPATTTDHPNPDKQLEISVIDTGIGIPKKSIKKIFQRFYQVDGSSTRKYVGTGLGLSIVKEILESHGSTIEVDSNLDQGSRFWFTLPLVSVPKINNLPTKN
jgi:signal transduction histidine kinase